MAMPGTETVRFRRPTTGPEAEAIAEKLKNPARDEFGSLAPQGWKKRHQGLLQEKLGRSQRGPLVPSLSVALRMLLLVRTTAAMYSIISDCDEVFNFYEPLHYFQHNEGFQTWELSSQFAIRSWSYVLLHWPLAHLVPKILHLGKRQQFFALRICLGFISSWCESKFYRAVVETVNERVGRYVLFSLLLSAGMWNASVAFLPSSFTMYTTLLASAQFFHPATSTQTGRERAYRGVFLIAIGAIIGWPFSAAIGIPFVFEQLFLTGGEIAIGPARTSLLAKRWETIGKAVFLGALVAIPVYMVDSWAYGRQTFPTFNIISYNLFSGHGPELYGTSPPTYYLANLFLNFNYLVPFALLSLPGLAITYKFDNRRLGKNQRSPDKGETSPYTLLTIRLLPFYVWLGILTLQPHKEERFAYPLYGLLCFNAAVGVYLVKGWMEVVYIKVTKSPYQASKSTLFSNFSLFAIIVPGMLSITRILAIHQFYRAPMDVALHFQYNTVPSILQSMGYSPIPLPDNYVHNGAPPPDEWDLTPLTQLEDPVTLCYGTEWHRYPGSYLIPEGIDVRWLQTDFAGMMPRRWESSENAGQWPRAETRKERIGRFNGANKASSEAGTFVQPQECDYIVALSLPSQKPTALEPDWASQPEWDKEFCTRFLDAGSTPWFARLVWLPWGAMENSRVYGDYCLLKRRA